jgi:cephalosporin hydroxylase
VIKAAKRLVKRNIKGFKLFRKQISQRIHRPNVFDLHTKERLGVVYANPSEMSLNEKFFLYALVRGSRPQNVIEIGSRHGGSASIIASAMMDINPATTATIFGVDPENAITVRSSRLFDRFKLVQMPSPEGVHEARVFQFSVSDSR